MGLRRISDRKERVDLYSTYIWRHNLSFSSNKNIPFQTVLSFILEKSRYINFNRICILQREPLVTEIGDSFLVTSSIPISQALYIHMYSHLCQYMYI